MSKDQTRRNFVGAAGITAAAVATTALLRPASAQTAAVVPKMEYAIKKLPFDPAKIKGISEKLLISHYENNYSGAVKRLNAITAQLAGLDVAAAPVFVINGLKREELIATNSMIIHELYFDGLGGEGDPKGALAEQMKKDFGGVARWKAEFSAVGKALGGGSGWVMLSYSPRIRWDNAGALFERYSKET
jgi:Fe-Mn family superoxide dismutase